MNETPQLSQMQNWGRIDFEEYEPCLFQGEPSPKRVIKTIIRSADRELSWRGEENANSLRDFWYNPTKPILERAFPEKLEDPDFDFVRRMSQYLSETLSEMVQSGEVTYRSLNILDESRERRLNIDSIENDKILFVEKEAAYRKLRPLEEVYEISIISGGGWQATALIEDLAHELERSKTYTLYVLTDYDPTGWEIAKDFNRRSSRLGINIGQVKRVGILPRQLDDDTIQKQRFSPPINSGRDKDWMARNAIEGQYGLEIEAIGDLNEKGEALRRMVVDELRDDLRVRRRRSRDTNVALANSMRGAADNIIESITDELEQAIYEAAVDVATEMEGIESADYRNHDDTFSAAVDFDSAEAGKGSLPTPYDEESLHEGAVNGERPDVNISPPWYYIRNEIQERIESGEIDPEDLLNFGDER